MKNALLALALFAFAGTAAAHDTPAKGKKAKKETCTRGMAAGCCMKGGAKATAATTPKAAPATVATKSL